MDASTVTSKGQVTIPKEIRRELGLGQGSRVAFSSRNGKVELRVLHRAPVSVESGFGMLDSRGKRMPADFDPASLLAPERVAERSAKSAGKVGAASAGKR